MMKLFLTVQLQPDDLLLSECLKSIKENYDLFDFIFISMISEPANGTEVLFAELAELANVRVRILPTPLDYGEHCRAIDHWIADFIQEGHIFRLDGNAILQRKGIEELKTLKLLNSDAAIGPFYIVSPQTALRLTM